MQTLEKDWDNYDATIYTDSAATQTAVAVSLPPLVPEVTYSAQSVHYSGQQMVLNLPSRRETCATTLILVQEDVSIHKVCIVSDSMSTLQRIQNQHQS